MFTLFVLIVLVPLHFTGVILKSSLSEAAVWNERERERDFSILCTTRKVGRRDISLIGYDTTTPQVMTLPPPHGVTPPPLHGMTPPLPSWYDTPSPIIV